MAARFAALPNGEHASLRTAFCWTVVAMFLAVSQRPARAQLVELGTPLSSYGGSWYERQGVGFGFSLPGGASGGSRVAGLLPNGQFAPFGNLQFTQGGFGSAVPAFGGYDPNASARFGFGVNGNAGGFRLGLELGKGSTRTLTSTAPSLMVQNGSGGFIGSGQWTPYVTGWIPVVGADVGPDNGVTRAVQSGQLRLDNLGAERPTERSESISEDATSPGPSTAETGAESVASIRARKVAERAALGEQIAAALAEREQQLAAGRVDLARLALNRAIALETEPQNKQRLKALLKITK